MKSNIFQWQSLKTRATLYIMATVLIGLLVLDLYVGLTLRDDFQLLLGEQQLSTASFIAADVNSKLKNRLTALELVAEQIGSTTSTLDNEVAMQSMLEQKSPIFLSMFNCGAFAIRRDGMAIASVPRSSKRVGINYMENDYIADAMREGKSTIGRPITSKKIQDSYVTMAVPIRNRQGKVIGALVGVNDLNMRNFLDEIKESDYGKTGAYALIMSQERLVAASPKIRPLLSELPKRGINPMLDRFIDGQENPAIFFNQSGVEMMASSVRIPAAGWLVAVIMPTEEALAPIHNMVQRMISATILLVVLASGLAWLVMKRQLLPIREATSMLESLADANSPAHLLHITKQDEIGTLLGGINHLIKSLGQREQLLQMKHAEMSTAKERAEESDRIKSAFLSNMVHDIRTPMNSIVGFSQLMGASTLSEKERKEYADIINSSSSRLFKTINNILDISRIETGQTVVKRKAFQVNRLLQELYIAHIDSFKQKKIEFKIEINPRLESLAIFSDEQKIYHIMNGLLDNAYKFTEKGHVEFGFDLVNKHLVFFVKDSGIGIPKSRQEFVFSKFYQRDISTNKGNDDTGLDLVLAKGFVALLGGNIWFDSEEGVGSTFKFTIPFVPPPASTSEATSAPATTNVPVVLDWSKKTILIAEDDINNYLLLKTILTNRTQVQILHAKNGHEALEIFKTNPEIVLILMDLKMPGMDGFTATQKIRELSKQIPIFALTAYSEPDDRKKAMEAGCNEFISKPIEMEAMLKLLASALEKV